MNTDWTGKDWLDTLETLFFIFHQSDVPIFVSNTMPIQPSTLQPRVVTESDRNSLNAFSDGEIADIVNGGMMKKYKSADDLESGVSPGIWKLQQFASNH